MSKIIRRPNPTKWLCTDGKTLRAGDMGAAIWWNVETHAQADAIVEMMNKFSIPELIAMFRRDI